MNLAQIQALIAEGESQTLEFKASFDKTFSWINDNQISIFSPGTFYGGLSVADIHTDSYRSSLRNKLVAEAFYLTGNIEKYGSGFIRIRQSLSVYPELDFKVEENFGGVMVTLSQPESNMSIQSKVLQLLSKGPVSKREISLALGQKKVSGQLNKIIRELLSLNLIAPTITDKPTSRLQKYQLPK
jgi:ATP-dependent DNA helicase RecG